MLGTEEIYELEESLQSEFKDKLLGIITKLNRTGKLEEFLDLAGMLDLIKPSSSYSVYKNGKILVIGQSDTSKDVLEMVASKQGIDKRRLELHLEYDDAKNYNFNNIRWNPSYSVIMVGPMGHNGVSKGDYSSVITAIENEEGYPPIIRLGTNSLKITKTDFKNKIQELIESGTIN